MKFTIDRTKWLRGEGASASFLRRADDGKMCCVGIFLKACGLTDDTITGKKCGIDVLGLPQEHRTFMAGAPFTSDISELYGVNDVEKMSEKSREERIAELFANNGVQVEFVN